MVQLDHHRTLGCFFLNHPPISKFKVAVNNQHALTADMPEEFETMDEMYMIELLDPAAEILLTTEQAEDPSPPGFGYAYDKDTSLLDDGKTRILGYVRDVGKGAVVYWALGHCHSPTINAQRSVDTSLSGDGKSPLPFRGVWETSEFQQLLSNSLTWAK